MTDEHREAIRIIKRYMYDADRQMGLNSESGSFIQKSYSKSAGMDLIDRIQENQSKSVFTIIEQYQKLMDKYTVLNSRQSIIFSIKHDFATYILDELIMYKELRRKENQNE